MSDGIDVFDADDEAPGTAPRGPLPAFPEEPPGEAQGLSRGLVVLAVLLTCAALCGAVLSWHHASRTVTTVVRTPAQTAASVDASGCPVTQVCSITAQPSTALTRAIRRRFPDAVIDSGGSVQLPDGTDVRSTALALLSGGVQVSVVAQCIPGGAAVPSRAAQAGTVVVPGKPGCSVAVTAHVPAGGTPPTAALTALAADPTVQLA